MQASDIFDDLLSDSIGMVQPNEFSMNAAEYISDPFNFIKCWEIHKLGKTILLQMGKFWLQLVVDDQFFGEHVGQFLSPKILNVTMDVFPNVFNMKNTKVDTQKFSQ